jgi:hypothetical protein
MQRPSPTLEGFQVMFRLPVLGLAEIAWRWSFGVALVAALLFSLREYLSTLTVTAGEMFLLRTRQPVLILQALAHIFQGSGPRAVLAAVVLTLAMTLAWIVLASLGRAATLKSLIEYLRVSRRLFTREPGAQISTARGLASLLALNSLRAATMLAASVGFVGAILLVRAASSPTDPSPGFALLIFWMLALLIALACSLLNWYLSLAAIFVFRDHASVFAALAAGAQLCRTRPGSLAATGTWFGLAHAVLFVVASSAAAFPLGFAEVLPGAMVVGGLLLVSLVYFAAVDFLYVGRLASYLFMMDPVPEQPALPSDDDILSDIPGLAPETAN